MTASPVQDGVVCSTCYMCACRCGIRVHVQGGKLRYIEGNPDHPVNRGVLCAKGSAGIMQATSPARLRRPLIRTGERGKNEFREASWDEALELATSWLRQVRETDPKRLAFFTGRDQSQSLTGWWAQAFGTPNFAAHGGFCSVNMAAAGLYTLGGSFWEFGEPDWEHTKLFLMFGVAEDHDSNPIKMGLGAIKGRGARFISVNPVRTGYSAIADEWIGIRPGTDGLLVMSLAHCLLAADRVDLEFLARYTNAAYLVIEAPERAENGLLARDESGRPLLWNGTEAVTETGQAAIAGRFRLADGRQVATVFTLLAERILDGGYAPEAVAPRCGVPAATIRRIAAEIAEVAFEGAIELPVAWTDSWGVRHETMRGRPVAVHAMRGISAHSNGFQTCRALHVLQMLIGAVDVPGSWRYKSPFPRPIPPGPAPVGRESRPGTAQPGPALGFPQKPEDLLVGPNGEPLRIDRGFSWEAPLALHGLMHNVIGNAAAGDPYDIDTLFLYMANMAWNSSMNPEEATAALTARDPATGEYRIPHIIYADAYASETVAYADLVLPDTTYLERYDCISLLDRPIGSAHGPADAIRQPVIQPDRDVRPFQDVLLDLGARLGLPGMVDERGDPLFDSYRTYMWKHERRPGVGPLAGFRGDGSAIGVGAPNPSQIDRYIENGCFWQHELPADQLYYKHSNAAYLRDAKAMGLIGSEAPITLQIYSEPLARLRLAAQGHGAVQPPEHLRERVATYCDPLPFWYPPLEETPESEAAYPLHAVTQRPMPMYHSWHGQNAWLRQIMGGNRIYIPRPLAQSLGIADEDWVAVASRTGRIVARARLMDGVNAATIWTWNAVGKRAGAWNLHPEATEATTGFLLNHILSELRPEAGRSRASNSDPVTGQAAWFDARVRLERATAEDVARAERLPPMPGLDTPPTVLRYNARIA
ncbi:MAG: molybdopterin-dependent oxidoreductase [Rhodospirillales bacterium]|nr:molybdopterin-dependent oxidoreductase [Rhodospirillales bacterium]